MIRDAEATSRIMSAVRSRDTKPELALRAALWHRGLRYRLRVKLPGKPDIVFPRGRVAVFVDGDFWHGNAWRIRGMSSFDEQFEGINNSSFWKEKILSNVVRDSRVNETLSSSGWTVIRVFESTLYKNMERVVAHIETLVRSTRAEIDDSSVILVIRRIDAEVG